MMILNPVLLCINSPPCTAIPGKYQGRAQSENISAERFLRSGSIKPHRSVTFVAADIRSVTVRDSSQKRVFDPIRSVTH